MLARLPRRKPGSTAPLLLLTDTTNHPGEPADTAQLVKARVWNESSGPRHYLRRHPALRKSYYALRVEITLPIAPPRVAGADRRRAG